MNRYLIALTALLISATPMCIPAIAQDQQPPAASSTDTTTDTTTATTTDKDKEEKEEKEYKARAEAEKRDRVEDRERRRERHDHDRYDDNGSHTYESSSSGLGFFGGSFEKSTVSLLVAPSGRIGKAAIGLQWIGKQKFGVAIWSSGDVDQEDGDIIDATIPHNDYHTENDKACYSLEGLYCLGTDRSMLILGVGFAVEKTTYTDISNVTGWKWKGGDDYSARPAAQIGYRALIAQRIGIQFGYDTSQYGYFGLTASF